MFTVVDSQKGLWDLSPPFLFLDQAEGQTEGQKKMIFKTLNIFSYLF